ncbi:hypothetical protein D3C83_297300 [compost metagenome]
MSLFGVDGPANLLVVVVEDLDLSHPHVGGVAFTRITNRETVVATRRQLEFEPGVEVG